MSDFYRASKSELLIAGYIRPQQSSPKHRIVSNISPTSIFIPNEIMNLMLEYFNYFTMYGIGDNQDGELGMRKVAIDEVENLSAFTDLTISRISDIFYGYARFVIKSRIQGTNNKYTNQLMTIGNNDYHSLGIGESEFGYHRNSRKMKQIPFPEKQKIRIISNGIRAHHTFIVTMNDEIYAYGTAQNAEFGEQPEAEYTPEPTPEEKKNDIAIAIAATDAKIDDYSDDEHDPKKKKSLRFKLANPSRKSLTLLVPTLLPNVTKKFNDFFKIKINRISCGYDFSIFLSNDGRMFGCGNNNYGQLGIAIKECKIVYEFEEIPLNVRVIDVQVGYKHTLCLSYDSCVYVCGDNEDGQLGMEQSTLFVDEMMLHPYFSDVMSISVGSYHSLCLTFDHQCFIFGNNVHEQICLNTSETEIYEPVVYGNISEGVCGVYHTVLIDMQHNIIMLSDERKRWDKSLRSFFCENGESVDDDGVEVDEVGGGKFIGRVLCSHSSTLFVVINEIPKPKPISFVTEYGGNEAFA